MQTVRNTTTETASEGRSILGNNNTTLIAGGVILLLVIFLLSNQSAKSVDALSQATIDDIKAKLTTLFTGASYATNFSHVEVLAQFKTTDATNNIVVNLVNINMPANFNAAIADLSFKTNILTLTGNVAYATELVKILRNDFLKKTDSVRLGRLGGLDATDTEYTKWFDSVKALGVPAQNPVMNDYLRQIANSQFYNTIGQDAAEAFSALQPISPMFMQKIEVRAATIANPTYTPTNSQSATLFKMEVKVFKVDGTVETIDFTRPAPMSIAVTLVLMLARDPDALSAATGGAISREIFAIADGMALVMSGGPGGPTFMPPTQFPFGPSSNQPLVVPVFIGRLGAADASDVDYATWYSTLSTSLRIKSL